MVNDEWSRILGLGFGIYDLGFRIWGITSIGPCPQLATLAL